MISIKHMRIETAVSEPAADYHVATFDVEMEGILISNFRLYLGPQDARIEPGARRVEMSEELAEKLTQMASSKYRLRTETIA